MCALIALIVLELNSSVAVVCLPFQVLDSMIKLLGNIAVNDRFQHALTMQIIGALCQ